MAALAADNEILLAGPGETFRELWDMLRNERVYRAAADSLLRIGAGFFGGFICGVALAAAGWRFPLVEEALAPAIRFLKAVPVASFVVLLLIWWGSSFLSPAVCFLAALPQMYISVLEGLKSVDQKMLEMAEVFRLPFGTRFFYIFRPAMKPFLYAGLKISLGLCWKSGVAAQVMGISADSLGEGLYLSRIYLNTAGVFAWTAVILLLSLIFEKMVLWLAGKFFSWEPKCGKRKGAEKKERHAEKKRHAPPMENPAGGEGPPPVLELSGVAKHYGAQKVLDGVSACYGPGETCFLTSPSGSGKTTLLRILAGLEQPDQGRVRTVGSCSMMFQEDRLCEEYSALKNVEMVTGDRRRAMDALKKVLEEEALEKPCRQLSGGMKRRVALVRAMEAQSCYVLLDEPFTGMDLGTMQRAQDYIRERQGERLLIVAQHDLASVRNATLFEK